MMPEVSKLVARLKVDFPTTPPLRDRIWTATPAVKVIDCVLSLRRSYDKVVVPRVDRFRERNPDVSSLRELADLMDLRLSPAAFVRDEVNIKDERKARVLRELVAFLISAQSKFSGRTEEERLGAWAEDARPGDYLGAGIKWFGLAGWQYLRMLFGADTTKPDVHVIRYVSAAVGREVNAPRALYLLEEAAQHVGCSLRGVDVAIWDRGARGGAALDLSPPGDH